MESSVLSLPEAIRRSIWPQLISPRPLALVSTVSAAGVRNIAPYNSYSGLATSPPMLGISISSRKLSEKRTLQNVRDTGEFVVNLTPRFLADVMVQSAEDTTEPVDDFIRLDLTPARAANVCADRIVECPAALECRVTQIVELPPSHSQLIVAQVIGISIRDEFYDEAGGFDAQAADLLASIGVDQYVSVNGETLTLPVTWE